MTDKTANKHELKTRETHALLLQAAETIFVRDGYEGAELGEIAALAGRTKGAIYAHFKSKEDIFLALIDLRVASSRAQMEKVLAASPGIEENIAALREFFLRRAEEPAWALLLLEYKLFALRHPESKRRYQERQAALVSGDRETRLAKELGPAAKGRDAISRVLAIYSLQPIICGLVLEAQLGTDLAGKKDLKKVIARIFDALLEGAEQ